MAETKQEKKLREELEAIVKAAKETHSKKLEAATTGKMVITAASLGGGLRIELRDKGAARWIFRYTRPLTSKKNEIKIGTHPDTSIKDACDRASVFRGQIEAGIDPQVKKVEAVKAVKEEEQKAQRTFGALLAEFMKVHPMAETTRQKNQDRINKHLPKLLPMRLDELTPRWILDEILWPIEADETRRRVRGLISQVLDLGIATGDILVNPARDLGKAIPKAVSKHFAAPKTLEELKDVWDKILQIRSNPSRIGLQLQFLTFQRPGNVRAIEWSEIDIIKKEWAIPYKKMKIQIDYKQKLKGKKHLVPLCDFALELISTIPKNDSIYCFPSERGNSRPMSDGTMRVAMRDYGITKEQATCHGSRTTASTLLNGSGKFRADVVEKQLAHVLPGGQVRNDYNHAEYKEEREEMMNWWGELFRSLS